MSLKQSNCREVSNYREVSFATPDITEQEIDAVSSCLRSGWLTTGPVALRFEKKFSDFMGGGVEAIAVNSCTAGLILVLKALGIGPGDEVITSTWTFTATAMSIYHVGATPILVDIDGSTLNISADEVRKKITSKTKALIIVHMAGLACNMQELYQIAKDYNIRIIDDAAHALPTTYGGNLIGSGEGADASVFSFYATKTITTGEGGMITTKDKDLAKTCRMLRLHGIDRDVFNRYTSLNSSWQYEVVAPGYKCNLTDLASTIGIVQLDRLPSMHAKREHIAEYYNKCLSGLPLELPATSSNLDTHAWHLYIIRLRIESLRINRDKFIEEMGLRGVKCSVHFIPCHMHPFWHDTLSLSIHDYPVANKAFSEVVSLPIHSGMSDADIQHVANTVKDILLANICHK
jgi:dTDP-4-amino-4,6-dideoxygalactose transaminase